MSFGRYFASFGNKFASHHNRHDSWWGHGRDRDHCADDDTAPQPSVDGGQVNWTLSGKGVTVNVSATQNADGKIVFTYEQVKGHADLTGFFVDAGNDGGKIGSAGLFNNMWGRDTDGDRLDGFDFAQKIGSVHGWDADNRDGELTVSLKDLGVSSLAELAEAEIGIRAGGIGWCGLESAKLAGTGTYTPPASTLPDEQIDLNFPGTGAGATSLTLVFGATYDAATNTWNQPEGDVNADWLYSVKLDTGAANLPTDLDSYIDTLLADLIEADPNVSAGSSLKGVFIQAEGEETQFYYHSEFNANGEMPDEIPGDFAVDPITGDLTPPEAIDMAYNTTISGDEFMFA